MGCFGVNRFQGTLKFFMDFSYAVTFSIVTMENSTFTVEFSGAYLILFLRLSWKIGFFYDCRRHYNWTNLLSMAGATGFEPAVSALTGPHVSRYTTPPNNEQ